MGKSSGVLFLIVMYFSYVVIFGQLPYPTIVLAKQSVSFLTRLYIGLGIVGIILLLIFLPDNSKNEYD